jgi:tRNA-specific 2-thiouridylase
MVKEMEVMARNARQPLQAALHQFENGMYVSFLEPQSAITGQFVAWYMEDELVGSGYFLDSTLFIK